jgi:hypothetical protein
MTIIGRWAVTAGVVGSLLVAGGGVAVADESSTPVPQPGPITLTPQESAWVCNTRIPNVLDRIAKLSTRIDGDASTRGSTAWLQAKEDAARKAGRTEVADAIGKRIAARPAKESKLAEVKSKVESFKQEHCS